MEHIPVYSDPIAYDVYEQHYYMPFGVLIVLVPLFWVDEPRAKVRQRALKERLEYYKFCRERHGKFRPLRRLEKRCTTK